MGTLLGVDFNELATQSSRQFVDLAMSIFEIAEAVALGVSLADERFDALHALAVATDFPKDDAALRSHDSIGLGVLEGSSLFRRNALRCFLVFGSLQVGQESLLGFTDIILERKRVVDGNIE